MAKNRNKGAEGTVDPSVNQMPLLPGDQSIDSGNNPDSGTEAPVDAPTDAAVMEFNPIDVAHVSVVPTLEAVGITGKCVAIRINPELLLEVNTPEKLYEHARAAWTGKLSALADVKHVVCFTKEKVEMRKDENGKGINEMKSSVLAIFDVDSIKAFEEADLVNFSYRNRESFCQRDKDTGKVIDKLLEGRWIFTGSLNEAATTACKGLFWKNHVPMFWHNFIGTSAEMLSMLSPIPPAKPAKGEKTAKQPIRSFA